MEPMLPSDEADIRRRRRLFQRRQIIEGNGLALRQQWAEALTEHGLAIQRKGAQRQAVEAMFAI